MWGGEKKSKNKTRRLWARNRTEEIHDYDNDYFHAAAGNRLSRPFRFECKVYVNAVMCVHDWRDGRRGGEQQVRRTTGSCGGDCDNVSRACAWHVFRTRERHDFFCFYEARVERHRCAGGRTLAHRNPAKQWIAPRRVVTFVPRRHRTGISSRVLLPKSKL